METDSNQKNKKNKKKNLKKCTICANPAVLSCTNCNLLLYCSKEHQKKDLNHRENCKVYAVETNKILGRYLVAARDIKQGELILKDSAIVVGPPIETAPLCLNCYKPIVLIKKPCCCPNCGIAPLCCQSCDGSGHTSLECEKFKSNPLITTEKLLEHCQILMALRCLFLREDNPKLWTELMKMEAHMERRRDTPIWRNHKLNIEHVLNGFGLLTADDLKNELVQKICGILDVNTFELRIPGVDLGPSIELAECVRGVYLQGALMAHDCIGNTHLAVDDNFNMTVHASVPIAKGTPIYFNYTNALQGTYDRQEHLKEGKYFNCNCKRCVDMTECGTHMSSIVCVKCHKGMVTPVKLTENIYKHDSIWKCTEQSCNKLYKGIMIKSAIHEAKDLVERSDKNDIKTMEFLIKKLLLTFAPDHSLIVDLKQSLVGLHSEILRLESNPNSKILVRKLQLCQELMPVLEKIEPGISRLRGLTLYEMHIPIVILANRQYHNAEISPEELLKKLFEGEDILKKAITFLVYEPSASPEGRLAFRAIGELKLLRNWIAEIQEVIVSKQQNIDKKRKKKK